MLAKLTRDMPSLPDLLFEPKWDGFRCVLFRDGDDLDLQSRNQKPLMRYFPELREPLLEHLPPQVVLDGELVIATPKGLNFDALQLRQHAAAVPHPRDDEPRPRAEVVRPFRGRRFRRRRGQAARRSVRARRAHHVEGET